MWVFYIPVWIQHFWLAIKARNLFFFLATNPAIEGFILSDSKFKTLQLVPETHRPKSILIPAGTPMDTVKVKMQSQGISFPLILKPDIGFRGMKVKKVDDSGTLQEMLSSCKINMLLQEYCQGGLETGIFYYRYPDRTTGHILSITVKEFLKVEGDGVHSLQELLNMDHRSFLQRERIRERFSHLWTEVLPAGEFLELEPVGNHNLGTKFIDKSYLADAPLESIFDKLNHNMPGFYFGRFDIRADSWEALKERQDFKILEVNGVGGEPTHIYDPSNSVYSAWTSLCLSWRVAARIASINFRNGHQRPTYAHAKRLWDAYTAYRSRLFD